MDVTGFPMGICSKSLNSSDFKSISLRMPSYVKRKVIMIILYRFLIIQKKNGFDEMYIFASHGFMLFLTSPPRESKGVDL